MSCQQFSGWHLRRLSLEAETKRIRRVAVSSVLCWRPRAENSRGDIVSLFYNLNNYSVVSSLSGARNGLMKFLTSASRTGRSVEARNGD